MMKIALSGFPANMEMFIKAIIITDMREDMLRDCSTHGYFRGEKCPDCGDRGKFLMNDEELNRLGRIIAGILRHFPERFGLEMDEKGYVDVIRLINMVRRKRHQFHWLRQNHIQSKE